MTLFHRVKNIIYVLLLLVIGFFFYNDFLRFFRDGEINEIEKAVQNAILKSGRTDLELSSISDYDCPRDRWHRDRGKEDWSQEDKEDKEVRTLHCTASAVFTNGTSADVSIELTEFNNLYFHHGRKNWNTYKINFSVTIQELGPNVQGESSMSKIINL